MSDFLDFLELLLLNISVSLAVTMIVLKICGLI